MRHKQSHTDNQGDEAAAGGGGGRGEAGGGGGTERSHGKSRETAAIEPSGANQRKTGSTNMITATSEKARN